MSDDGFSDCFDEPTMEIQIKTLMGTTFDIKISSTDTVGDIKRKIYRVEGIPIHQQNLLFRSRELQDTNRLCDVGVQHGSVLTLVAAMRGGPISTRRLSMACEHHVVLKELKELLENTRDEISDKLAPGSKVSVLVFKEGDIINLLRVIENEDGSYSPYSEKPISPPSKPHRNPTRNSIFERLVEDSEMNMRVSSLRRKMADASIRRQSRLNRGGARGGGDDDRVSSHEIRQCDGAGSTMSFKFLTECANDLLDKVDLRVFERSTDDGTHSETEEIALKEKHRSKSKFSENKGVNSHAKQNYARMHKKTRELRDVRARVEEDVNAGKDENALQLPLGVPSRNRVHLTRLVLSDSTERPKSTPDSLELEENAQDLWEIHEPASERLKHSATCKVGLLKRRQSLDYGGFDGLDNASNVKPEFCNNEFEVCSGNFYHRHVPQFVASPSAIPPQYAPKEHYYFRNNPRSPLYGRKSQDSEVVDGKTVPPSLPDIQGDQYSFFGKCSNIQRLKNDCAGDGGGNSGSGNSLLDETNIDDLYGYYNLGCSTSPTAELLGEKKKKKTTPLSSEQEKKNKTGDDAGSASAVSEMQVVKEIVSPATSVSGAAEKKSGRSVKAGGGGGVAMVGELLALPPVVKKKARCNECNKRLNITNIYDCRCGKVFCSQHRYSEVHRCSYDYKTEGRRLLHQQNPLIQAEKVNKI